MAALLVAQVLWLLGQDEQLLRPRVGTLRGGITVGALVDVLDSRGAGWAGTDDAPQVRVTGVTPSDPRTRAWVVRLAEDALSQPIPVIHAINSLGSGTWEAVGGSGTPRPGDRGPPAGAALVAAAAPSRSRRHPPGSRSPAQRDPRRRASHVAGHGVLAAAWCADVAEHILSRTPFIDPLVVGPTRAFLEDSALVRRLNEAVSYPVSLAPGLGITSSWPGTGR